ncbi:MAG: chemotaxis response regulator protein-glutamate methylesterase [Hyphomicrobiales bacterium]|nr:chemotaxis response regulator protein-glutamate methylesterase [Hyphomicrobiales bacterium]
MGYPIRVLVVDDSPFMRRALKRRIESDERFQVADTAEDGREAVEKAIALQPDVVTLDVEMPVLNGLEALRQIVARTSIPVVMVSSVTEAGARVTMEALSIGAIDFVQKSKAEGRLHETLLAAAHANPALRRRDMRPAPQPVPLRPPPAFRSAPARSNAKIVVIGSSTGGPQALEHVLAALPADLHPPIVVAQHMPPHFTAVLAKRLDGVCALSVREAAHGEPLAPGVAYIAPGGAHLRVGPNGLIVAKERGESLYCPSVDVLAESARDVFGRHVLAVMLTGMGNDGARGFQALKAAGATIIAQDQGSSVVYGMPKAVADAGAVDEILPLSQIGPRVRQLLGR